MAKKELSKYSLWFINYSFLTIGETFTCKYFHFHSQSDCTDSQWSAQYLSLACPAFGWNFGTCCPGKLWAACNPCWCAPFCRSAFLPRSGTRDLRRGRFAPYLFSSKHRCPFHRTGSSSSLGRSEIAGKVGILKLKIKNCLRQFFPKQKERECVFREESFLLDFEAQTKK